MKKITVIIGLLLLFTAVFNSCEQNSIFNSIDNSSNLVQNKILMKPGDVEIDIKPGSDKNPVNCTNIKGKLTVAILTTPDFDATTIDHTTVRFGVTGSEAMESHVKKKTGEVKRHEEDVDGDGDVDLLFHFKIGETGLSCGDKELCISGETYAGLPIQGCDAIDTGNDPEEIVCVDIDGNVYQTIQICDQIWTTENLKVTRYRNGDPIPNITDNTSWRDLSTGAYCNYDNDVNYVEAYGRLYNWYAVDDSRGLAPEGWHIPSDEEWKQLEMCLGMSQSEADGTSYRGTDEGGKLKEPGIVYWRTPNTGATNESGFTARGGGGRVYVGGAFGNLTYFAHFWSVSEDVSEVGESWYRLLDHNNAQVSRMSFDKWSGFSIRFIKD